MVHRVLWTGQVHLNSTNKLNITEKFNFSISIETVKIILDLLNTC